MAQSDFGCERIVFPNRKVGKNLMRLATTFFAAGMAGWIVLSGAANAAGAIAVGQTRSDDAVGWAAGYSSAAEAARVAMQDCRTQRAGSACRVVARFQNQCGAFASEREGVTGFGWAVATDQRSAEQQALGKCRASSSRPQTPGCRVVKSFCDR
jgi:hypothetical protein